MPRLGEECRRKAHGCGHHRQHLFAASKVSPYNPRTGASAPVERRTTERREETTSLGAHSQRRHHSRLRVLRDMAVQHPRPGIGQLDQQVHSRPNGNNAGVFPDEVWIGHAVSRDLEKALPVQVQWVIHWVK